MIKYNEQSAIDFWQKITPFELLDFKFSRYGQILRDMDQSGYEPTTSEFIQITLDYLNDCQNS